MVFLLTSFRPFLCLFFFSFDFVGRGKMFVRELHAAMYKTRPGVLDSSDS